MNPPVKILFLIGNLDLGGKERQMVELIKSLPRPSYSLHLMAKSLGDPFVEEIRDQLDSLVSAV